MKVTFKTAVASLLTAAVVGGYLLHTANDPEQLRLDAEHRAKLPGRFIKLHEGYTWYEVAGPADGAPVILLHGLAIDSSIWEYNFEALANAGYRVLRYDQYGRGYSDRPSSVYDHALFVRQLHELLNGLWIARPVTLVCVSAGCPLAADFASTFPQRVRQIVIIDPQMRALSDDGWRSWPLIGELLAIPELESLAQAIQENYAGIAGRYDTQRRFRGYRYAMLNIKRAQAGVDPMQKYAQLAGSQMPVTLIQGEGDRGQPLRPKLMQVAGITDYREIPNAPHGSNFHAPEAANRQLLDALTSIAPNSAPELFYRNRLLLQ